MYRGVLSGQGLLVVVCCTLQINVKMARLVNPIQIVRLYCTCIYYLVYFNPFTFTFALHAMSLSHFSSLLLRA